MKAIAILVGALLAIAIFYAKEPIPHKISSQWDHTTWLRPNKDEAHGSILFTNSTGMWRYSVDTNQWSLVTEY